MGLAVSAPATRAADWWALNVCGTKIENMRLHARRQLADVATTIDDFAELRALAAHDEEEAPARRDALPAAYEPCAPRTFMP